MTAFLSDGLLRQGSRVMLYADADEPISNGVYQNIGCQLVDDVNHYDLAET